MRQHPVGLPSAQHIGVIDVGGAGHHGMHQGQNLSARQGSAHPSEEADYGVDQGLQL